MKGAFLARLVAGVVAAAGATAMAVVGVPTFEGESPTAYDVDPPAPVVGCPGEQVVPVGDVGSGGDLASEPSDRTFRLFSPGDSSAAGDGFAIDAAIAGQMERIGDGDIAGWSALTCQRPALDQWLVGGSTSLGASARLVLTNPSAAPSEVTVTLFGPLGEIEDTALIPVPAGGQADRLLEGISSEQPSLVVHVEATGPGVVAALQDSRLQGFQPAGTAWVGRSELARSLVIPALGFSLPDAKVTVRLMAPEGASVDLTLVSAGGVEPWSTGRSLVLEPGVVTDLAVPASTLGAIEVDADAPVLAAARTVVPRVASEGLEGDTAFDATWVPGMTVTDATLTAVSPADDARIAVYSPYATTVTFADPTGVALGSASIDARTVTWVDLNAPAGTVVSASGEIAWAYVAASEEGYVASASPVPLGNTALEASVVPKPYPAGG